MNFDYLIAFLIAMIILSASPGPGVFASMATAAANGFKQSLFFICGLILGDSIFFLFAVLGLSYIASMLGELFVIIKILGGFYLIFLGIKMYRQSNFRQNFSSVDKKSKLQIFISGLFVTLSNPKAILFYAGVLPTIIDLNKVRAAEVFTMILLIALVLFMVIGTYCYLASLSGKLILNKKSESRLNRGAGIIMVTTGSYIILK